MKVALIIAVLLLPAIVLAETCEKGMLVVQREEREISTSAKNCTCPSGYYCLQCADGNSGCFSTRHGQCCGCDSAGLCYACSTSSQCRKTYNGEYYCSASAALAGWAIALLIIGSIIAVVVPIAVISVFCCACCSACRKEPVTITNQPYQAQGVYGQSTYVQPVYVQTAYGQPPYVQFAYVQPNEQSAYQTAYTQPQTYVYQQ